MYTLVRGIATGTVPAVPAGPDARLSLVPVDDVARLCVEAALDRSAPGGLIRTLGGGGDSPTVPALLDTIVDTLNVWRAERDRPPLVAPRVIAPDSWQRFFRPFARDHLSARQNRTLDLLGHFEPYLAGSIPVGATHLSQQITSCVHACLRYWADTNPRLAATTAAPWRSSTEPVAAGAGR
jgi:nucleoside-diphosphate-sugar epimerase